MHANYKKANSARRCSRVLSTGSPCTQPALRGRAFCRFHDPIRNVTSRCPIPFIEDAATLQVSYAEVISSLVAGKIDKKTAELCFQGLRLAAGNLKQFQEEMESALAEIDQH